MVTKNMHKKFCEVCSLVLSYASRQTDRQTNKQVNRHTHWTLKFGFAQVT